MTTTLAQQATSSTVTASDGTRIFYKDWGSSAAGGLQPRMAAEC